MRFRGTFMILMLLLVFVAILTLAMVISTSNNESLPVHKPVIKSLKGKRQDFQHTDGGRCLKNYFEDVLLIIVYHYPFYATIPLVKSNYEGAFPHIIVCGAEKDKSGTNTIMVVDMDRRGYLTHECVGKAIRVYPDFRGYLMVNDDMLVNWWNFAKLDKDKIWQGARVEHQNGYVIGQKPIPDDWFWKLSDNGAKSCEKAYKEFVSLEIDETVTEDISKMLKNNLLNGRNNAMCFRTWSDFVYIPGIYSKKFELLCSIFYKHKVFLEIAFPTITSFLVTWEELETVYGVYLPDIYGFIDFTLPKNVWPQYSESIPFLHPIKIAGPRGSMNRKEIARRLIPYGKKFLNCSRV